MWTKQQPQTESSIPPTQAAKPSVVAFSNPPTPAPGLGSSPARGSARLGSSLQIKGHITGTEDLQIDGKVDGPISLRGHALTVGPAAPPLISGASFFQQNVINLPGQTARHENLRCAQRTVSVDVDLEAANPAGSQIIDGRADGCED